jgi:hypothetical protein
MDGSRTRTLYRTRDTEAEDPLLQECLRRGILKATGGRFYERVGAAGEKR